MKGRHILLLYILIASCIFSKNLSTFFMSVYLVFMVCNCGYVLNRVGRRRVVYHDWSVEYFERTWSMSDVWKILSRYRLLPIPMKVNIFFITIYALESVMKLADKYIGMDD